MIWHYHPPLPTDESLYHQKEPTETTLEELKVLRRLPRYTLPQKILQVLMFVVFGIPKIILVVPYTVVAAIIYVILCALWRGVGRPSWLRRKLKGLWAILTRIMLFLLGFYKKEFEGQIDPDARFICPNHTCFFDGWMFFEFQPRILGKKELLKLPIMREVAEVFEGVAVDRGRHSGVSQLLVSSAADPNAPPFLIFPEGASTSGDYMLRFHTGAFLSDLPIQPVAVRYTIWGTTRSLSHISFFHHSPWMMLVFLGIPGITMHIKLLPSMSLKTAGFEGNPRKLADATSIAIGNELGVRVISLSSSSIYKKEGAPADKKND